MHSTTVGLIADGDVQSTWQQRSPRWPMEMAFNGAHLDGDADGMGMDW